MKKIKILIITIITLFILITSQTAYSTPTVRFEGSSTVSLGETFSLDVFIDGVAVSDQLLAVGFDIAANPGFTYNGATLNSALFFDTSPLLSDTEVSGMAAPGLYGDNIAFAALSFTATMVGNLTLGILSDTSDPFEGLHTFLAAPIDISFTKNIVVSVPAPESVVFIGMLVGIGMIGIFNYKENWAELRS